MKIAVDDPRLEDRVADNLDTWKITESESLLFGTNFGVITDVETGPNGNLSWFRSRTGRSARSSTARIDRPKHVARG
jgi:hypothetical protein